MKKIYFVFLIIALIISTTITKNSTKKLDIELFETKENIRTLNHQYEYVLLDYNYLSSPKNLMEYQSQFFENELSHIDVKNIIQPKGLYFTRPVMGQYLGTKDEIREGTDKLFEKVKLGKVKIEIFKKYKLEDVIQAHKDLEARKITGPSVIIP